MIRVDPKERELARLLLRHSVKARKGELVMIHGVGTDCLGLVQAIMEEALHMETAPYFRFSEPEIQRAFLHRTSKTTLDRLREFELSLMEQVDCFIGIRGSRNIFELSDVPPRKMDQFNKLYASPIRNIRINRTRWCVLRYPNSAMAQLAGQPRAAFKDFYFRVCTLDYPAMTRAMRPLKNLMERTDVVEIKGPGTDLRFSIKGIPTLPCGGEKNIPDGECFTGPVRESVEGTVSYNTPSVWEGKPYDNIRLKFREGRVVEAEAGSREQTRSLNKVLDQDEGARYVGEFALGFNPEIRHPMRDILFDEKISGSFHMALGQAYSETDNGNVSALHWDMVCIQRKDYGGGEIYFDGKLIRKDGLFVPKSLQKLNPKAFGSRA